eukprot:6071798-Prymnesium_polylepis.2
MTSLLAGWRRLLRLKGQGAREWRSLPSVLEFGLDCILERSAVYAKLVLFKKVLLRARLGVPGSRRLPTKWSL